VRALPDGLSVREATSEDHDGIIAVCTEVFDGYEGAAVRHLLTHPGYGPGRWTVVVDADGAVVSTCVLLTHRLRYGQTEVPAVQIEFVATREHARKKGLVRAQFDLHHRWAAEQGALVLLITGIPYLYRRLGYGYGFAYAPQHRLLAAPKAPDGWTVEPATASDLPEIERLQVQSLDRIDVALCWPETGWSWLLEGAPTWEEQVMVARQGDTVGGFARVQLRPEENYAVAEGAADAIAPAQALLAETAARTADVRLFLLERVGDPWGTVVRAAGASDPAWFNTVYARIPDPVAFLDHVRPELSARLAASPYATERGELALSFYEDGVILTYADGVVTDVRRDPDPALDAMDDDKAGIAPDAVPALFLGRFGARELEVRQDDVGFVADRDLVATLFPRLVTDLCAPL